ncbi:MAG: methionine-R-sulfoxide reductase [Pirellulaceae bacterium]|nr:methionine-R-sulfoxide reductase [Pirellulaceae bacterium]
MSTKNYFHAAYFTRTVWSVAASGAIAILIGCAPVLTNAGLNEGSISSKAADNPTTAKPAPSAPKSLSTTSKMSKLNMKYNELSEKEADVLLRKGTERAWVGELTDNKKKGTYVCRRCNAPLYKSDAKFESHCGWPSFDEEIKGTVDRHVDTDGHRTEIVCANCEGHLGHVFMNEGFTAKNARHCVNSISMRFFEEGKELPPVVRTHEKITSEKGGSDKISKDKPQATVETKQ